MIITTVAPSVIRVIIRIYFILILGLAAVAAKSFLQSLAKYRVAKSKTHSVPALHVLGGLDTGLDLITGPLSLRAFPRGRVGYVLMAALWIFGKASDILTTYLVVPEHIKERCPFDVGLVFAENQELTWAFPPFNGQTLPMLRNAQLYATNNTCSYGIYEKANTDQNFCPSARDTLGSWICTDNGHVVPFDDTYDVANILDSLVSDGYLYPNVWAEKTTNKTSLFSHLVAWSTSADFDADGHVWKVKAAIQMDVSASNMKPLTCQLQAPRAESVVGRMNSLATLSNWTATYQGLMYWGTGTPMIDDPQDQLAMLLNAMVMIEAGSNSMIRRPAPGADTTQGCIKQVTHVPAVMIVLIFVAACFFLFLSTGALCTMFMVRAASGLDAEKKKELGMMPGDVTGWAQLSIREHNARAGEMDDHVKDKEVKNYQVGFAADGSSRLRLFQGRAYTGVEEDQPQGYLLK